MLHAVDARSDQYSFCVTLHLALYGELPFEGKGEVYNVNLMAGRVRSGHGFGRASLAAGHPAARPVESIPRSVRSLDELLAELRNDPDAARRRRVIMASVAAALLTVVSALALRHAPPAAEPRAVGPSGKLAGAWDDDRRRAVHAAFAATGSCRADDA